MPYLKYLGQMLLYHYNYQCSLKPLTCCKWISQQVCFAWNGAKYSDLNMSRDQTHHLCTTHVEAMLTTRLMSSCPQPVTPQEISANMSVHFISADSTALTGGNTWAHILHKLLPKVQHGENVGKKTLKRIPVTEIRRECDWGECVEWEKVKGMEGHKKYATT